MAIVPSSLVTRATTIEAVLGFVMSFQITDRFRIRLGGNTYINVGTLVTYQGQSLFDLKRHEDGYLGIYFDLFDARGNKIAVMRRNKLYFAEGVDRGQYVEDGGPDRYTLRNRSTGLMLVDVKKRAEARPDELDVAVRLYTADGFLFDATPDQTNLGGVTLIDNVIVGASVGIAISDSLRIGVG